VGIAYQRGMLLYNQHRYSLAADEFRKELAQNSNGGLAMGMLALCLCYDRKPAESLAQAEAAIAADPERGFVHYVLACVIVGPKARGPNLRAIRTFWLIGRRFSYHRRLVKARKHAMEAIRLEPRNAEFLALMSAIALDLKLPKQSLEWADKALAVRANHVRSTNLRARALAKLGRRDEARQTFQGALALDPDSAVTHSHGGWTHLHIGDANQAVEHFQQSVRLNPDEPSAHQGLRLARKSAAGRTARRFSGIGIAAYLLFAALRGTSNFSSTSTDPWVPIAILGFLLIFGLLIFIRYRRRRS
jgi:tetratricopeptide (TPR) repeat protein